MALISEAGSFGCRVNMTTDTDRNTCFRTLLPMSTSPDLVDAVYLYSEERPETGSREGDCVAIQVIIWLYEICSLQHDTRPARNSSICLVVLATDGVKRPPGLILRHSLDPRLDVPLLHRVRGARSRRNARADKSSQPLDS